MMMSMVPRWKNCGWRITEIKKSGNSIVDSCVPKHFLIQLLRSRTLEECCCHFIDRLDLSAEGPFVNMGLIFRALGCGGVLVMLDRREEVPLSLVHCPSSEDLEGVTNTPIVIHL